MKKTTNEGNNIVQFPNPNGIVIPSDRIDITTVATTVRKYINKKAKDGNYCRFLTKNGGHLFIKRARISMDKKTEEKKMTIRVATLDLKYEGDIVLKIDEKGNLIEFKMSPQKTKLGETGVVHHNTMEKTGFKREWITG